MLLSSGMGAGTALLRGLSTGDRIVIPTVMHHGLREWVNQFSKRWNLVYAEFDPTMPGDLENKIRQAETRLVWIETPCNPTWDVTDIATAAMLAHDAGAKLAVDQP